MRYALLLFFNFAPLKGGVLFITLHEHNLHKHIFYSAKKKKKQLATVSFNL